MTIIEMHTLADLLMDKANAPWFNSPEKDTFIRLAELEFVKTRYREFELNEKRREDLRPLVRVINPIAASTINTSAITGFMFVLSLSGDFPNTNCGSALLNQAISPIQLDDYKDAMKDPFNRPSDSDPKYIQRNNGTINQIEILSDNTPTALELNYLKAPVAVFRDTVNPANNVDSELPDHVHEEIVNLAVRKMLKTVEDQFGYQTQINEIQNQE